MMFKSKNSRMLLGSLLLVFLGLAFAFGYMYYKPHPKASGKPADFIVTAQEFLKSYTEDEAAADAKYLDKIIEVKGLIKQISPADDGSMTITLGDKSEIGGVSAALLQTETEKIKNLKVGDKVTIKGFCSGYLMDVIMVKCMINE
ncbi:MAG: hypothetical protein NW226_19425 [Microscillaceae bacterium]|nr:hypothetical protein [Microscillaceae bacterium]